MFVDVMIDIETLDTKASAVILSIGAVSPYSTFYLLVDPEQRLYGRTISMDTLKFWSKQAVNGNPPPLEGNVSLVNALMQLKYWIDAQVRADQSLRIWANGTHFDITILETAFQACDIAVLWKYNAPRDYRTLRELFPNVTANPIVGVKHNALADATYQYAHLRKLLAHVDILEDLYEAHTNGGHPDANGI